MATFQFDTGTVQKVWSAQYLEEYFRTSGYEPYTGTSEQSIIRVNRDLMRAAGDTVNIPFVKQLFGAGKTNNQTLVGNEDQLDQFNDKIKINMLRNAVPFTNWNNRMSDLDMMAIARSALVNWSAETLRQSIDDALQSVITTSAADSDGFTVDTAVKLADANDTLRDAHLVANIDRFYGVGGLASNSDFSAALAGIGNTDKLSAAAITAMKAQAKRTWGKTGVPAIKPYKSDATAGRDWYVLFVDSNGFGQLAEDTKITDANQFARQQDVSTNPIFQGGDLIYNGVIIREIPQLGTVDSSTVGMASLCGLSAVGVAYGQMPTPIKDVVDYDERVGVGIREERGTKKLSFAGVQYGCLSVLHYSA